jgi:hypothetical protein
MFNFWLGAQRLTAEHEAARDIGTSNKNRRTHYDLDPPESMNHLYKRQRLLPDPS